MDEFKAYGAVHLAAVVAALVAWIAVVRRARKLEPKQARKQGLLAWSEIPSSARRFSRALAWFILISNGVVQAYRLWPDHWNVDASLPLHLCDFAWMASIWALWNRDRRAVRLVFFWGFGLSWQAFLTPTVDEGPGHIYFWAFFALHWQIVATSLLAVAAWGFRPTWRDWRVCLGVTSILFFAVLGLNLWLETPYFFNSPGDSVAGTPIALLGDWPLRLLWLILIVAGLFALMTLITRRRGAVAAPESKAP